MREICLSNKLSLNIKMNKKLEELFNLDPAIDVPVESVFNSELPVVDTSKPLSDRIDQALPQIQGIGQDDNDVDTIAEEAMNTYREIKDLAMNVEPRHSAELLAVAAQLLKTALDAKQGKSDAKLKAVRLQISAVNAKKAELANVTEVEGKIVGSRNDLIANIKKSKS